MSEKELNEIIAKNIRHYMDVKGLTQNDIAKSLNVAQSSISNWVVGIKLPRMDKIDKLCTLFGCTRSDLMTDAESSQATKAKIIDMAELSRVFEKPNSTLTYNGTPLTEEQINTAKAVLSVFKNVVDK